jgi:hypothetical protein
MASIPPELAAVLASINARLGAIEAAIGGAGPAVPEGDAYCRLAADFNASVVNVSGAALYAAAEKLGDEGKKLVRAGGRAGPRRAGLGRARPPAAGTRNTPPPDTHPALAPRAPPPPALPHPLQADIMRTLFNFVLEVTDIAGKSKKPGPEVRNATRSCALTPRGAAGADAAAL